MRFKKDPPSVTMCVPNARPHPYPDIGALDQFLSTQVGNGTILDDNIAPNNELIQTENRVTYKLVRPDKQTGHLTHDSRISTNTKTKLTPRVDLIDLNRLNKYNNEQIEIMTTKKPHLYKAPPAKKHIQTLKTKKIKKYCKRDYYCPLCNTKWNDY